MALPIQSTPTYNLKIPSSSEDAKFRPFLIKEEKALLLAQQSEDPRVMADTLKSVISSCLVSKIDVEKLALFDLEYLFTQIRAKSVGETVELIFACDDCDDEKARVKLDIDLTKIDVKKSEDHSNKIQLFDDVGVVMKYPNFNTVLKLENANTDQIDSIFEIIYNSIDYIYNSDEIYHSAETAKEEVMEFINNLTQEQFGKIQKFFDTIPKLSTDVKYTCPVCNKEHDKVIEGLTSFFQ